MMDSSPGTQWQHPGDSAPRSDLSHTVHDGKQTVVTSNGSGGSTRSSSLEVELSFKEIGPYKIHKVLGFGAMATVYQAEDTQLNRQVALKVLNKKWLHDPVAKERFLREAKLASLIKSKHVVLIHAVGEENGIPYLAMELLEGFALERLLSEKIELTVTQILRLGREIARGLAAAHEKGLIHRDIKPANIWLETVIDESGGNKKIYRVKLLDFGMARLQEQTQGLTRHGMVVGTPFYMSPEQATSSKIDARSDLFSLGVVLYQLSTGMLPFQGETAISVMSALIKETPTPVHEVNPEIPRKLSRLIEKLLSKLPEDRPSNAINAAKQLEQLERDIGAASSASHRPVQTESTTETGSVSKPNDYLAKCLIASVILNVVLLVAVAFLIGRLFTSLGL
jgi:serine/threonine protein kinase